MSTSMEITHEGVIESVSNNTAFISFQPSAGCSGCSIRSSCGMADSSGKMVEIPLRGQPVRQGQNVVLRISQRDGYKAVLLSYFIPFLLMVSTLFSLIAFEVTEPVAAIISMCVLIPYYVMLKLFSARFKHDITFEVQ